MENGTIVVAWRWYEKLTFRLAFVFVVLFLLSFSFPHHLLPDPGKYLSPGFETIACWFAKYVLHLRVPYSTKLYSDTTGMYVTALLLLMAAVAAAEIWTLADRKERNYDAPFYWFRAGVSYYLALQLMVYGFDKVFKTQFYLPEPNTLYTPLGDVPRDLLYWSTMGVSRPYCVFTGCVELLCAVLLLFRRTRNAGAFLSALVLVNVVAINLCYDISVKLYSMFLLLLAMTVYAPRLAQRIRKGEGRTVWAPQYSNGRSVWLYKVTKTAVVALLLCDALYGYVTTGTYNGDRLAKPPLYGAWHVDVYVRNGDTLAAQETDTIRWRRVFIHSQRYLVAQHMNDELGDYALAYDTTNRLMMISDADNTPVGLLHYELPGNGLLQLAGTVGADSVQMALHRLATDSLPLLQNSFRWTIDQ